MSEVPSAEGRVVESCWANEKLKDPQDLNDRKKKGGNGNKTGFRRRKQLDLAFSVFAVSAQTTEARPALFPPFDLFSLQSTL